jgi:hypothetical protein
MKGGKEAVYTGGGNVISSATMEISMRFLKNIKMELPYDLLYHS